MAAAGEQSGGAGMLADAQALGRPPLGMSPYRSHSLPRSTYANTSGSLASAAVNVLSRDPDWERGVQSVVECGQAVNELTQLSNKARCFKDKCAKVMGAAMAAVLALKEALASRTYEQHAARLRPLRVQLQLQIQAATALVRKYGRQTPLERWFSMDSREWVDAQFDDATQALQQIKDQIWELLPQEYVMRLAPDPQTAQMIKSGDAFHPHRIRSSGRNKLGLLLHFFYPDQPHGHDGCVAWASNRLIKLHDMSGQVSTTIECGPEMPSCMCHDPAGYLLSGHEDGTVRAWGIDSAAAASGPLPVAACPITVLARDPQSGLLWAGCGSGEIGVIRFMPSGQQFGKLELLRMLLGYDAHSPALSVARTSIDTNTSSVFTRAALLYGGGASSGAGSLPASRSMASSSGAELLDCLPLSSQAPRATLEGSVHQGPVRCIVFGQGHVYTAGGDSKSSSQIMVWDAAGCELLRVINKRVTPLYRSPVTAMVVLTWARLAGYDRAASSRTSDCHLITGHDNGEVLMWDTSGDTLRPVLHLGRQRSAVKAFVICGDMNLLCTGQANGKVALRRLDANWRVPPRDGAANISQLKAPCAIINAHRLGILYMVGGCHLLFTAGGSGSIKAWPEHALRLAAQAAGVKVPPPPAPISQQGSVAQTSGSGLTSREQSVNGMAGMEGRSSGRLPSEHSSGLVGTLIPSSSLAGTSSAATTNGGATVPGTIALGGAGAAAGLAGRPGHRRGGSGTPYDQYDDVPAELDPQSAEARNLPGASSSRQLSMAPVHRRLSSFVRASRSTNGSLPRGFENASWNIPFDELKLSDRPIGAGSYGRVYKATWKETEVAVKEFNHAEGIWDTDQMRQEVEILAELRHPNVVELLGVCLDPPAVVTNFYAKGSLYDVLQKARNNADMSRRLTWRQRLNMALGAAKGMNYLHTNKPPIVHRDLKSPNLFVDQFYNVKVGDFNLSRYLDPNSSVVSGPENNPRWSAPEVFEGTFSKEADVYSFGVVLWELLTWQEPWAVEPGEQGWNRSGLNSYQIMTAIKRGERPPVPDRDQLPGDPCFCLDAYVALMEECWAQDPGARPSFQAIIQRLNLVLREGRPVQASVTRGRSEPQLPAVVAGRPPPAGKHKRSSSEAPPQEVVVGDLIRLDEDDMPGPSQPRPPAAALPPVDGPLPSVSASEDDGLPPLGVSTPVPSLPQPPARQKLTSPFARGNGAAVGLPPVPHRPAVQSPFAAAPVLAAVAAGADASGEPEAVASPTTLSGYVAAASAVAGASGAVAAAPMQAGSSSAPEAAALPAAGALPFAQAALVSPFATAASPFVAAAPLAAVAEAAAVPSPGGGAPVIGLQVTPAVALSPNNPFAAAALQQQPQPVSGGGA